MRDFSTDDLLQAIEILGSIPVDTNAYAAADLLRLADREMQTMIVPLIMAHRARHFLTYDDVTMTTETRYPIPETAINRALQNVALLDASGNPEALLPIDHDREMEIRRGFYTFRQWDLEYSELGFYFEGDELAIFPRAISGRTLRLFYYRLPNRLVETSAAGLVTGVDTGTGVVTCAAGVPSTITTSTPICAVAGRPGFGLRFEAVTPSNKAATTVTIAAASAALVSVGDWIALEGDSPIPQIPVECHPILAQATVVKVLTGLGHPRSAEQKENLGELINAYVQTNKLRAEQAPKRILPTGNRLVDRVW